jgi:DNA-binding CsgD family transcriptional regulator
VRPETAAKLLAVTPGDAALQPTLGTSRRLQALVAIGYTQTALAQRIGWTPSNFTTLIHARHPYVHHTTATAVDELYQELSGTPGGNSRAQAIARRHGWMPPLAWDDIDNPDERAKGRRPTGESVNCLDVLELYEAGNNIAHIAGRLGISENSVHTYLSRARKAAS